jgi:hypothetical protein
LLKLAIEEARARALIPVDAVDANVFRMPKSAHTAAG